ncbi:MAG: hypothetical protein IJA47_02345 [Oscillospiraceae bacterium]|nr:hypothetical protein [Oscillospiraceae bacterium]
MKKFLAMLLVLVMVLPMCLVAEAGEIDPNAKPFYFVNWSACEKYKLGNTYDIFMIWMRKPNKDTESLYCTPLTEVPIEIESTPVGLAQGMYAKFASYPEGTRYIYVSSTAMSVLAEDNIFMDKGVELTKQYYKELITEYYILGGELDGVLYDFEYNPSQSYYISQSYVEDPELFNRIVANPRYQNEIRPMLVERGFKFYEQSNYAEIYSIYIKSGDEYDQSRAIWNTVMRDWTNQYMLEAASPIFKYYKKATLSDYRRDDNKSWQKHVGQSGGTEGAGGHVNALGNAVGNVTNENAYFYRPAYGYYVNAKTKSPTFSSPLGYNNAYFEPTPYNQFSWMLNDYKNMALSNEEGLLQVWLGAYKYMNAEENPSTACSTPLYTETLIHIGMLDPDPFIGWVTEGSARGEYPQAIKIISDTLYELTRVVGAADRKPILTQHNWNDGFQMSGMYAGGRNVWRITPNTYTGTTVEKFKVEGTTDPTFYIDGQTITFPSGKIIENGSVYEAGMCGYWIETPADVAPIVTADEDRYIKYPAFQENYNGYEVGMDYSYNNVNPVTSWLMKKDKSSTATIQADKDNAENKVLALTGTHTLKNVIVTERITAGDTKAEDQGWEVTVTIPEKMGDKAEVILLGVYNEESFKAIDGGFKIAKGKVYYANAENKYVELEGVNVSKGGKFTVRRLVDFNNAEAFVSDYEVYDAEGKLLGSVQDVPFAKAVTFPVEGIGIACSNVDGDPVLVDNYKLYITGVTTDFELYEKHIGMKITDTEKPTDQEVVARLSWLNATNDDKQYAVVAEYYNGDTKESTKTVKKITLGHGLDGEEIIEVPAKEGKSVLVYLKDITKAKAEDKGDAGAGLSVGAIIAIVAAGVVVLAGAAVGAVLLLKKKKLAAAPVAEDAAFAEIATAVEAETNEEETPEEPTAE